MNAYTGPERRSEYRFLHDWSNRFSNFYNKQALEFAEHRDDYDASDALWNGWWFVNQKLEFYRASIAEECAPWFSNEVFA